MLTTSTTASQTGLHSGAFSHSRRLSSMRLTPCSCSHTTNRRQIAGDLSWRSRPHHRLQVPMTETHMETNLGLPESTNTVRRSLPLRWRSWANTFRGSEKSHPLSPGSGTGEGCFRIPEKSPQTPPTSILMAPTLPTPKEMALLTRAILVSARALTSTCSNPNSSWTTKVCPRRTLRARLW